MRTVILMLIFASVSSAVFGQKEKKKILDGNKEYKAEQYENAEELYEESLSGKETPEALYNLGNALYRQGEFEKAAETFLRVTQSETASDELKSKAYHNLGNSYMSQEQVQKGADAYKDGLRKNPKDEDTRHNLSYALRQLQQMKEESSSEKMEKKRKERKAIKRKMDNKREKEIRMVTKKERAKSREMKTKTASAKVKIRTKMESLQTKRARKFQMKLAKKMQQEF
jgi:tetratricopeptide (TPR) repeat protein